MANSNEQPGCGTAIAFATLLFAGLTFAGYNKQTKLQEAMLAAETNAANEERLRHAERLRLETGALLEFRSGCRVDDVAIVGDSQSSRLYSWRPALEYGVLLNCGKGAARDISITWEVEGFEKHCSRCRFSGDRNRFPETSPLQPNECAVVAFDDLPLFIREYPSKEARQFAGVVRIAWTDINGNVRQNFQKFLLTWTPAASGTTGRVGAEFQSRTQKLLAGSST